MKYNILFFRYVTCLGKLCALIMYNMTVWKTYIIHTHTRTHEVQNDLIELSIYVLPSCADLPSSMCPFCEWLRERGWGREREREEEKREEKG